MGYYGSCSPLPFYVRKIEQGDFAGSYDIVDNAGHPVADVYENKCNADCIASAVQACMNIAPILHEFQNLHFVSKRELYTILGGKDNIITRLYTACEEFFKTCEFLP